MRRSRGGRHAYFLAKVPVCQPVSWPGYSFLLKHMPVRSKSSICWVTPRELREAAQNPIFFARKLEFVLFVYRIFDRFFLLGLGWVRFGLVGLGCRGMRIACNTGRFFRKLSFAAGLFGSSTKRQKTNFFARKYEFLNFGFSHPSPVFFVRAW